MGKETITGSSLIADLVATNPTVGDPISEGDDHIRGIKKVLQNQFTSLGAAVTVTAAELNYLDNMDENVKTALTGIRASIATLNATLPAPSGTRLVFHQSSAPTGWTQVTTFNDYMLRVVSTAGGGYGGTHSPVYNDVTVAAHTHSVAVSGSTASAGSHTHTYTDMTLGSGSPAGTDNGILGNVAVTRTTNSSGDHAHTLSATGTAYSNTAVAWQPKYLNMILASKD